MDNIFRALYQLPPLCNDICKWCRWRQRRDCYQHSCKKCSSIAKDNPEHIVKISHRFISKLCEEHKDTCEFYECVEPSTEFSSFCHAHTRVCVATKCNNFVTKRDYFGDTPTCSIHRKRCEVCDRNRVFDEFQSEEMCVVCYQSKCFNDLPNCGEIDIWYKTGEMPDCKRYCVKCICSNACQNNCDTTGDDPDCCCKKRDLRCTNPKMPGSEKCAECVQKEFAKLCKVMDHTKKLNAAIGESVAPNISHGLSHSFVPIITSYLSGDNMTKIILASFSNSVSSSSSSSKKRKREESRTD